MSRLHIGCSNFDGSVRHFDLRRQGSKDALSVNSVHRIVTFREIRSFTRVFHFKTGGSECSIHWHGFILKSNWRAIIEKVEQSRMQSYLLIPKHLTYHSQIFRCISCHYTFLSRKKLSSWWFFPSFPESQLIEIENAKINQVSIWINVSCIRAVGIGQNSSAFSWRQFPFIWRMDLSGVIGIFK
jgi:hypothetical protein